MSVLSVCVSLPTVGLLALLSGGCSTTSAKAVVPGQQLYASCATCHGAAGEGNPAVKSPALAGLPAWYLTEQLERYRSGLRGRHPSDVEGLKMRAMVRQLRSPAEIAEITSYITGFPSRAPATTMTTGDATQGAAAYALCAACHGERGEGNQTIEAPPLVTLEDWYLADQMRKFRLGIRGTAPGDEDGAPMQAAATMVEPDVLDDLAAHIRTLRSAQ